MKTYTKEELKAIISAHQEWLQTRWDDEVRGERANLLRANLRLADLRGANLSGANLLRANLRGANLRLADLRLADLRGADLRLADLRGANLSGANLSGADLRGANLSGADLLRANLSGANLSGADLSGADLSGADLSGANLEPIKRDYFEVLSAAPNEVLGVLEALNSGRVDGSAYQGECACLVGTIANLRNEYFQDMSIGIEPDSDRPAERWFLAIREGSTPENCPITALTAEWTEEWIAQYTQPVA